MILKIIRITPIVSFYEDILRFQSANYQCCSIIYQESKCFEVKCEQFFSDNIFLHHTEIQLRLLFYKRCRIVIKMNCISFSIMLLQNDWSWTQLFSNKLVTWWVKIYSLGVRRVDFKNTGNYSSVKCAVDIDLVYTCSNFENLYILFSFGGLLVNKFQHFIT